MQLFCDHVRFDCAEHSILGRQSIRSTFVLQATYASTLFNSIDKQTYITKTYKNFAVRDSKYEPNPLDTCNAHRIRDRLQICPAELRERRKVSTLTW